MKTGQGAERKIRILVISDHPVLSRGLAELIQDGRQRTTVQTASKLGHGLSSIQSLQPHLALLDLSPPTAISWSALGDLHTQHPDLPILVFSTQEQGVYAERALRSGARGYLIEKAGRSVGDAIDVILDGNVFLSPAMSEHILESIAGLKRKRAACPVDTLSDRELEVLQLIGEGRHTCQIADLLQLSANTVAVHRSNLKKKLNIRSANELVFFAVKWCESIAHANAPVTRPEG